jgi:alpha-muurolene/germacrene-A/gamma-muurolene/(+)-delta-cadinol synthase
MVVILMRVEGLGLQEAVDHVGDMCCSVLEVFQRSKRNLPKWGPQIDGDVERYLRGLESWLVACLHWSFLSGRYFGKKGLAIKETRIVELLPSRQTLKDVTVRN